MASYWFPLTPINNVLTKPPKVIFNVIPLKARMLKTNRKNNKRFNNLGYLLFFLMGIFLKHLRLIPDILKWQNCKIFTNLVPSQNPSRRSHRKCSVKKIFFTKSLGKTPVLDFFWTLLKETPTQVFSSDIYKIFKNTYLEEYLRTAASDKT